MKLKEINEKMKKYNEEFDTSATVKEEKYMIEEIEMFPFKKVSVDETDFISEVDKPAVFVKCPCGCDEILVVELPKFDLSNIEGVYVK